MDPGLLAIFVLLATPVCTVAESRTLKIILVGDSTVTDDAGWGPGFKQFLTDDGVRINTAMGGRSSQNFMTEGRWSNALAPVPCGKGRIVVSTFDSMGS